MTLVPNWQKAHRMFSIQVTVFWTVVAGLFMALPAFQDSLDKFQFAGLCVGFSLLTMFGRLTHQPGVSDA